MKVRAVIFDVYGTLLQVDPPPADVDARWDDLWRRLFGGEPRIGPMEFAAAAQQAIAREHARANAVGILWPEVYWPDIVHEVLPEIAGCSTAERDHFMFEQAGLWHTVRLMDGAKETLGRLLERRVLLGIASNAQPYTLRELELALASGGLSSRILTSELCFWSFAHGFSKPNPYVFRLLAARLRARGISPDEILMVGDRMDNDIAPAHAQGWRTWRLTPERTSEGEGDWCALAGFLHNCT